MPLVMQENSRPGALAAHALRAFWALPGALSGATVAFHLYFRQPGLNTDTAAPLVLAVVWSGLGLLIGAVASFATAWVVHRALRRAWPASPALAAGGALACVVALAAVLQGPMETLLPTLLWPAPAPASSAPDSPRRDAPCTGAAPADPSLRREWDLECR
jgi:hypothetical protein